MCRSEKNHLKRCELVLPVLHWLKMSCMCMIVKFMNAYVSWLEISVHISFSPTSMVKTVTVIPWIYVYLPASVFATPGFLINKFLELYTIAMYVNEI